MTYERTREEDMAIFRSPELARKRTDEIFAELKRHHPKSEDLLGELGDLISTREIHAEERAVIHHGKQIMAVIEGRGYQGPEGGLEGYESSPLLTHGAGISDRLDFLNDELVHVHHRLLGRVDGVT